MPFLPLRAVSRLLLGLMAPADEPAAPPAGGEPPAAEVRVVAANISSGNFQSYPNPGPGARILRALAPDVVLIQEFSVNATAGGPDDAAAVRSWVDDVLGPDYEFFREPGGESIPNGVISRFPIVEGGEWRDDDAPDRDFAFVRLDVPGPIDLWAVSVHLLTSDGKRPGQAEELVARIEAEVPAEDYLIVGGDLNTDRRNEPAVAILGRVVDTLGPFPDDGADPPSEGTNASRAKPYDWVLADADLEVRAVPTVIGDLTFPDGLVFDSRAFSQEELDTTFPGVLRDDSGAVQMQHMAVVRDFRLGGEDDDADPDDKRPDDTDPDDGDPDDGTPPAGALVVAGFRLEQTGGDAAVTLPAGIALAPGGLLVIGRDATRDEFETFWGPLDPEVTYLDGAALAGDPGFPIVNGGERYRLVDANGAAVDPAAGLVPEVAMSRGESRERRATDGTDFSVRDQLGATPGRYAGRAAAVGGLVVTEVSDARQFQFEFVELLYDAAAQPPPPGDGDP